MTGEVCTHRAAPVNNLFLGAFSKAEIMSALKGRSDFKERSVAAKDGVALYMQACMHA